MVGCHAVADKSEGGGHALIKVNEDVCVGLHKQVGGVNAGGASSDDCYAQGAGHAVLFSLRLGGIFVHYLTWFG